MFNRIITWLREAWSKMIGTTDIKTALNVDLEMSAPMVTALQNWSRMYINDAEWLSATVKSMQLPAGIASEIARSATIEMKVEVTAAAAGSKAKRADFLNTQMQKILPRLREQLEYGCAKGGLMIKPYVDGKELAFDFVQADQFYPVGFANAMITSCVFSDQRKVGDWYYTRLELHAVGGGLDGGYLVKNAAFRSTVKGDLGVKVGLDSVESWKDLQPEATIRGVDRPLFAYFRYPQANNVDPSSPLGVSCFARAVDHIKHADEIYSNLVWEFESGERAIYVDTSSFDKDSTGKPILPQGKGRLYRTLNQMDAAQLGEEGFWKDWSPEFRDASIKSGLDAILKRIEFNSGLAYGTLSDPNTVDKTATEILSSKQRSAATIVDTQKALETTLDQLLYAMDIWATLNKLSQKGNYEAVYEFDDSLVTDKQQQFSHDQIVVGMGAMSKVEFRMRNYGESEEVAKQKVAEAQAEQPADLFEEEGT